MKPNAAERFLLCETQVVTGLVALEVLVCLQEHEAVIKALSNLDPDRKCFRLVGEVLVERTVSEVLPAVSANHEQIGMVRSFFYHCATVLSVQPQSFTE